MAERRMFAKTIIDSDMFLEMPLSAQALYFHLSMRADDEGFLNNAKKIMRSVGANQNDYDLLVAKRFIIQFDDGICVIKHWRVHNYIRSDRFKPTMYQDQKSMLTIKDNNAYSLDTAGIPNGYRLDTQDRLGKDSIGYIKNKSEKKLANAQTYFDDECLNNTFLEFIKMRKSLKNGAMTERAITMMVNKLNKVDARTAVAMLEQSILNNWKDVYELKNPQKQQNKSNKFTSFPQRDYSNSDMSELERKALQRSLGGK